MYMKEGGFRDLEFSIEPKELKHFIRNPRGFLKLVSVIRAIFVNSDLVFVCVLLQVVPDQ